jgi:adenosylcobinamide-GDP ribazoletransferase
MAAEAPPPATAPPSRWRHEVRLWLIALQFLTRVPIPQRVGYRPEWLQDSARHFAGVGLAVGLVAAATFALAAWLWTPMIATLAAMAVTAWVTGGFHEDGLADTCDGLGGSVSRARALEIMKDSRIGSYGALGLGLTLAIKAAALAGLADVSPAWAAAALVVGHAGSRAASVALLRWLPYAGDPEHAKAKPLAQRIGSGGLAVGVGWALAAAGLAAGGLLAASAGASVVHEGPTAGGGALAVAAALALALGAAAGVALVCARWFRRRLGGVTGDTLGATQQWAETAMYLAMLSVVVGGAGTGA